MTVDPLYVTIQCSGCYCLRVTLSHMLVGSTTSNHRTGFSVKISALRLAHMQVLHFRISWCVPDHAAMVDVRHLTQDCILYRLRIEEKAQTRKVHRVSPKGQSATMDAPCSWIGKTWSHPRHFVYCTDRGRP
jgi:hypothetical protein